MWRADTDRSNGTALHRKSASVVVEDEPSKLDGHQITNLLLEEMNEGLWFDRFAGQHW